MTAIVRTVLGDVPARSVGRTLIHEHLLCDLCQPSASGVSAPILPEDAFAVRWNWGLDHPGHHRLDDRDLMVKELEDFRSVDGDLVVDLTVRGIAPNPLGLFDLAARTGVRIVAGTGWYTAERTATELAEWTPQTLERRLIDDLEIGIDGGSIPAGIIGEIGCSWPLEPCERLVLEAAARAQAATGFALTVHPGCDPQAPFEILDIVEAAGGDAARTIICHLDRTINDLETLTRLADRGCGLEWDFFGINDGHYPFADVDLPNDAGRLRLIAALCEAGHHGQILVAHDICTRSRLRRNGGHGYVHLLKNVVPLMKKQGFGERRIERLLIENPVRFLTRH